MKIILANCTVLSGNRGCVALSFSIMYLLSEILNQKGIEYNFYLPQSGFNDVGKHTYNAGGYTFDFFTCREIRSDSFKSLAKNIVKWKDYLATRKIYKEASFILDVGQGDSFSDIYGKERFNWIFSQYKLGHRYNVPYCILPQTIGPFSSPKIRKQACRGISRASCVMVRDKQSFNYVKKLLPKKSVTEIIDVAFFMPYQKKTFDSSFIHIGLNVSALLWHGGYTRNNQFGLKVDYQKLIHQIINYFLQIKNVKLHLIPHVVGGERGIENDYAVSYDLYDKYNNKNLILAPLFLDPITAKNYIAGMDFFMGARMHSTIAAFSSGVPVVPMAYSRKFNGLFVDTLEYPYMVDMKNDNFEIIIDKLKQNYIRCEFLKNEIKRINETVVRKRKEILNKNIQIFFSI